MYFSGACSTFLGILECVLGCFLVNFGVFSESHESQSQKTSCPYVLLYVPYLWGCGGRPGACPISIAGMKVGDAMQAHGSTCECTFSVLSHIAEGTWGTAPAAGILSPLGQPSVSDPWGVVCRHLSLGRPGLACVCGVHCPLALIRWCGCPVSCLSGVLYVRCPWPLGACSPVRVLCVL